MTTTIPTTPSRLAPLLAVAIAATLAIGAAGCSKSAAQMLPTAGTADRTGTPAPTTTGTDSSDGGIAIIGPDIPADGPPFLSVDFQRFDPGFLPATVLDLGGGILVTLDGAGSSPIFGPGLGFTTNYLSTGVQRGRNDVHVAPPPGTRSLGLYLVSVHPITLTAVDGDGLRETVAFSSQTPAFIGFSSTAGIELVTVSSEPDPRTTPIVNIAEIRYSFS